MAAVTALGVLLPQAAPKLEFDMCTMHDSIQCAYLKDFGKVVAVRARCAWLVRNSSFSVSK